MFCCVFVLFLFFVNLKENGNTEERKKINTLSPHKKTILLKYHCNSNVEVYCLYMAYFAPMID